MRDFIAATGFLTLLIVAVLGTFLLGGSVGVEIGRKNMEREAVRVGAGRWTVNEQGEKRFEWNHTTNHTKD